MRTNKPAVPRERRATTQEEKMSVFGNIVSAIFGSKHAAGVTAAARPSSPSPSSRTTARSATPPRANPPPPPARAPGGKPPSKSDRRSHPCETRRRARRRSRLEKLDRRFDEAAEIGQRPRRPQATGAGARLHRRPRWLGGDERLAAKAGHDEACRERRQGAGQSQGMRETRARHPAGRWSRSPAPSPP